MRRRDVIQRYVQALREYVRANKDDIIVISVKRTEYACGFTAITRYSYDGIGKVTVSRHLGRTRLLEFEKGIGLHELARLEITAATDDIRGELNYDNR